MPFMNGIKEREVMRMPDLGWRVLLSNEECPFIEILKTRGNISLICKVRDNRETSKMMTCDEYVSHADISCCYTHCPHREV